MLLLQVKLHEFMQSVAIAEFEDNLDQNTIDQ